MPDLGTILTRIVLGILIPGQYGIVASDQFRKVMRENGLRPARKSQSFLEKKIKSLSSLWFIDTMMGISNPSALKSWWFQGWTVFEF